MSAAGQTGFNADTGDWIIVNFRRHRAARPGAAWLTRAQAAHALGCCLGTVRNLGRAGKLTPAVRLGEGGRPHPMYAAAEVEALAAERREAS
jgi:hypothetical protein